jgi:hypothetical protein
MTPSQLQTASFQSYPPQGRQLAVRNVELLRQLPLSFLPLLLREVIAYDYKFPVEKEELDHQFTYLQSMPPEQIQQIMRPFSGLRISPEVERLDWINSPVDFSEQLSAHLWNTHQIDAFRAAAVEYVAKLDASRKMATLPVHRLGIVVIGQGASGSGYTLFRKLRPHGVHYKAVAASRGYETLLQAVAGRATKYPGPFAHWHIDGGRSEATGGLACVSYDALKPVRAQLQIKIQKGYESAIGSEALRTALARMRPEDVGLSGAGESAVLNRFQLSLLTEGSGTQIFSTTFVQWAAREVLRRAQPLTLLAHFTPRQKEDDSRELLTEARRTPALDPEGSLVDADMGGYYTWINQQRLVGAAQARFLVWFEGHDEAVAIAPHLSKGTAASEPIELKKLIDELA